MGGPAKSQLVHEVDALGGEIGRMADRFVAHPALGFSFTLCSGKGTVSAISEMASVVVIVAI